MNKYRIDIEVYSQYGDDYWAQSRYLVHGYDDVLWTDSAEDAAQFILCSLHDIDNMLKEIMNKKEMTMSIKFGDIFYSEYFKTRGVVVSYIDDKNWWFVLENRPSHTFKAQSPPSELKWETREV